LLYIIASPSRPLFNARKGGGGNIGLLKSRDLKREKTTSQRRGVVVSMFCHQMDEDRGDFHD